MKPCLRGLLAVAALLAATPHAARADVSFSGIHHWVGEGTNTAALVIDWTDETHPNSSVVWGYRWSGSTTVTVAEMLAQIVREDRRLHLFTSRYSWGLAIDALGYDADGDGGLFHYQRLRGGNILAAATDTDDLMDGGWMNSGWWEFLCPSSASATFAGAGLASSWVGVEDVGVAPNSWYALRFAMLDWYFLGYSPPVRTPAAAESPYAWQVVDYKIDTDPSFNPDFNNPQVVLGRPALSTVADSDGHGGQGTGSLVPVTPVLPTCLKKDIVSLANPEGPGGVEVTSYVTVQFDHPVLDDPMNPYGVDFIVFGNTLQSYSSSSYLDGVKDPATVTLQSSANSEPGIVEVSQNGTTWFGYTAGPFADAFAPTLGRVYNTNSPVANLFTGGATNRWWGLPTDPTFPVDPTVTSATLNGKTLAQCATYYNGSAGGTGFDLASLALPTDAQGRKWIRYVRVVSGSTWTESNWSEIDAFADVSPAAPYDQWARQAFSWMQLPYTNVVGKGVVSANGRPNFYNAAMGVAPTATAPALDVLSFAVTGGVATATFPCAARAEDAHFFLQSKTNLASAVWSSSAAETRGGTVSDGHGGFTGSVSVPVRVDAVPEFFQLGVGIYE